MKRQIIFVWFTMLLALFLPSRLLATSKEVSDLVGTAMDKANARNFSAAYADFDKAIKLEPQNAFVFGMRGVAKQIEGDFNGSIADFRKSLQITPITLTRFYYTIALRRMKLGDSPAGLKQVKTWKDDWERTVGGFLTGAVSEKELLNAAAAGPNAEQHKCEALYYAGMERFFKLDMAGAKDLLTQCTALKLTDNIEDMLARGELARMSAKKP